MVAASFNNECLMLVNYVFDVKHLQLSKKSQKLPPRMFCCIRYMTVLHVKSDLIFSPSNLITLL